ncbi:MAG TPA: 2-oxoacid:acceptor oxidoreductase subunit alpha [Candidatus Thermoplasmatota archaeon]|nr:2-oxoacid:acceptor oxidoreductase subunit alpha [Candidatus Thermoplasmatota archaeon]
MAIVNNVCWRIGGQQGEGIDTTGDIFARAMVRYGLHIYTTRNFSSRIRGGLTWSDVRVSENPVRAAADSVNYLVALGQEVIDGSLHHLCDGAVILYDSDAFEPKLDEEDKKRFLFYGVPMTKIAEEKGSKIMKNMVALGASAALLDMKLDPFYEFVEEKFSRKGQKIVDMNRGVLDAAYNYVRQGDFVKKDPWTVERRPLNGKRPLLMTGNMATAFGAAVGGCRFFAGYPITPATEVMEYMIEHVEKFGGVVVQTEDEIAAANMILGAGFAGVRAATSTSGPGLSLMTEAIGLAGMAEIPCVFIDVMRPGPSTGLPTKHGQTDLLFTVHGGHDEFPRIVVSPSTIEEAFYMIQKAFNYAEQYQLPVFYLIDQDLGLSNQTVPELDVNKVPVNRGKLLTAEQLAAIAPGGYDRFKMEKDHVSPRAVPGMKNGLFLSSGSEHNPHGVITENVKNRNAMMEKRAGKLKTFRATEKDFITETYGDQKAKIGIVTWGSTRHPVDEARARLKVEEGIDTKVMVVKTLWPFPAEEMKAFMAGCDKVFFVEANFSGQLASITKQEVGGHDKLRLITKYDGTVFKPVEILNKLKEMI